MVFWSDSTLSIKLTIIGDSAFRLSPCTFQTKVCFLVCFLMQTPHPKELSSVSCPVNLWKCLCLKIAVLLLRVTIVVLRLRISWNVTIFQLHSSDFVNIRAMLSIWAIRKFIKTPAKLKNIHTQNKHMIRGWNDLLGSNFSWQIVQTKAYIYITS